MKVTVGIERWTIQPETLEELIIMQDYMDRLPKVTPSWDTLNQIKIDQTLIQDIPAKISGLWTSPYLILDFDPDENLEKT